MNTTRINIHSWQYEIHEMFNCSCHNFTFCSPDKVNSLVSYVRSLGSWMKRQGKSRSTAAEEMQSVYAKESEILTKNIGSEPLRRNNVVLSHESLKMIAILHESMVSGAEREEGAEREDGEGRREGGGGREERGID